MLPVTLAAKPADFDAKVRRPGLSAIRELIGKKRFKGFTGKSRKKLKDHPKDIPGDAFPPLWREAKDDLLRAYGRICAYAALYIHPMTGGSSVDHFVPKSQAWWRTYKWGNYRLCCSLMNSRKNHFEDVLDPFEVRPGMFALDLVSLKAVVGPEAGAEAAEVQATITRLGLDEESYANALAEYFHAYHRGEIDRRYLRRHAPFLAAEMERQGKTMVNPALAPPL